MVHDRVFRFMHDHFLCVTFQAAAWPCSLYVSALYMPFAHVPSAVRFVHDYILFVVRFMQDHLLFVLRSVHERVFVSVFRFVLDHVLLV